MAINQEISKNQNKFKVAWSSTRKLNNWRCLWVSSSLKIYSVPCIFIPKLFVGSNFSWDRRNRLPFRPSQFSNNSPHKSFRKNSNTHFPHDLFDTSMPEDSNLAILLTLPSLLHFWSVFKSLLTIQRAESWIGHMNSWSKVPITMYYIDKIDYLSIGNYRLCSLRCW